MNLWGRSFILRDGTRIRVSIGQVSGITKIEYDRGPDTTVEMAYGFSRRIAFGNLRRELKILDNPNVKDVFKRIEEL